MIPSTPDLCYYARPGGVLMFRWLPDKAAAIYLDGALDTFAAVPGFAAGVRFIAREPRACILIWAPLRLAAQVGAALASALGPGDLQVWPGHLHVDAEWLPLIGEPHTITTAEARQAAVPDWLINLIAEVPA